MGSNQCILTLRVGRFIAACSDPVAVDNASTGNTPGDDVEIEFPLQNDSDADGMLVAASVQLTLTGAPAGSMLSPDGKTLTVPGEGEWTVAANGDITFTPEAVFKSDPTPVSYTVEDNDGNTSNEAMIAIDYGEPPVAADDLAMSDVPGPVMINPLGNDSGEVPLDPTTVVLTGTGAPAGSTLSADGKTLTVPGEGVWSVNPTTGLVTFTPAAGFSGGPAAPLKSQVTLTAMRRKPITSTQVTVGLLRCATRLQHVGWIPQDMWHAAMAKANRLRATQPKLARRRTVGLNSGRWMAQPTEFAGPCEDHFKLARTFNLDGSNGTLTADGQVLRDQHDCLTDSREVFVGSLSYLDTDQGQTQSAISLSYRREEYRGSDSVFGYFVGLYDTQSDVTSRANGDIRGVGVNGGIYGAKRVNGTVFLDYYLGAATGRHTFDLAFDRSIGTINASGDYTYLAGFAGGLFVVRVAAVGAAASCGNLRPQAVRE